MKRADREANAAAPTSEGTRIDPIDALRKASDILTEIKRRGEHHEAMRDPILRWHEDISAGKLSARAAFTFGGFDPIVRRLVGLPIKKQDEIADGAPLPVVELNAKREIVTVEKPVIRMNPATLERVFGEGKVRTVRQQEQLLRAELTPAKIAAMSEPYKRVRIDETGKRLVFGNMKVAPSELKEALRALGWELESV